MKNVPVITVLAGVNGAGKSSVAGEFAETKADFFFNPDTIAAKIRKRWNTSRENLIRLLPCLNHLRVFDNTAEGDPAKGHLPHPVLVLEMQTRRITAATDLTRAPAWAHPILAAALRVHGGEMGCGVMGACGAPIA